MYSQVHLRLLLDIFSQLNLYAIVRLSIVSAFGRFLWKDWSSSDDLKIYFRDDQISTPFAFDFLCSPISNSKACLTLSQSLYAELADG